MEVRAINDVGIVGAGTMGTWIALHWRLALQEAAVAAGYKASDRKLIAAFNGGLHQINIQKTILFKLGNNRVFSVLGVPSNRCGPQEFDQNVP